MEEVALQFVTFYEIQQEIAARFVLIRKVNRVSQKRMSEISGVPYATIRRFEKTGNISLESLVKLALAFRLYDDLDALFAHSLKFKTIDDVIRMNREWDRLRKRGFRLGYEGDRNTSKE